MFGMQKLSYYEFKLILMISRKFNKTINQDYSGMVIPKYNKFF